MVRALFSVVVVVLLSAIAFLLYANYVQQERAVATPDTAHGTPPPAPRTVLPLPMPVIQPPAPQPPPPAPEVRPRERVEVKPVAPPEPEGRRTYTVVAGDSLWIISKKNFGTPEHARKIAEMNKLGSKDRIKPGQVLYIPDLPMVQAPVEGSDAAKPDEDLDQTADKGHADTDEVMPPTLSTQSPKP
jgi:nucleoid-associated protein YgaU